MWTPFNGKEQKFQRKHKFLNTPACGLYFTMENVKAPLARNSQEAAELAALAADSDGVSGVCFNYRHYPLVTEVKETLSCKAYGEAMLVQGGYLQDWLLHKTDYNWRLDAAYNGPSRAIADIGSHWCDLLQYVTGQKITEVMADLKTAHPFRYKSAPNGEGEPELEPAAVNTEDYGSVLVRFDGGMSGVFTVSQVSAGHKNRLHFEVSTESASIAWDQEEPNRLWIGRRDEPNRELIRNPSVLSAYAASLSHYPGGHQEGWPDALKNLIQNFYDAVVSKKTGVSTAS